MKPNEFLKSIQQAGPCLVAEYRGSIVERVGWVDKTDGKAKPFVTVSHLFEFGVGSAVQPIRVDESVPQTVTDPKLVQVPFQRGKRYLVQLRSLNYEKGTWTGRVNPSFAPIELEGQSE